MLQAISDEHTKTGAAIETVVSSRGETPRQETPVQKSLSEYTNDSAVLDQQASEQLGKESVDHAESEGTATAYNGSPEQPEGEEEVTSERQDEEPHTIQEVLIGMCVPYYYVYKGALTFVHCRLIIIQHCNFSDGVPDSEWKEMLQTFFKERLLAN